MNQEELDYKKLYLESQKNLSETLQKVIDLSIERGELIQDINILSKDSLLLEILEEFGVDKWSGFKEAYEYYLGMLEDIK